MYNRVKRCINRKDRLVKHKDTLNSLKKNFFNNLKKNVITYANVRQARYIIWMRITRMRSKSILTGVPGRPLSLSRRTTRISCVCAVSMAVAPEGAPGEGER